MENHPSYGMTRGNNFLDYVLIINFRIHTQLFIATNNYTFINTGIKPTLKQFGGSGRPTKNGLTLTWIKDGMDSRKHFNKEE